MLRWLVISMLAFPAVAAGEPSPKEHAAELAAESAKHYKRGEFEISIALLREAYADYPEPNLLYNLARSLERLGNTQEAIAAYRKYLETGREIEDRSAIERRVQELQKLADNERSATPPLAPVPTDAPRLPDPARLPAVGHETSEHSKLPWLPIIGGVALVGGGFGVGYFGDARHDAATREPIGVKAQALQDDARHLATLANVLFISGGVAVAAGIVWELVERRASRRGIAARAIIGPGTIAVQWSLP